MTGISQRLSRWNVVIVGSSTEMFLCAALLIVTVFDFRRYYGADSRAHRHRTVWVPPKLYTNHYHALDKKEDETYTYQLQALPA